MSEFRQDPVTGRWVIIASGRAARPWHIDVPRDRPRAEPCPFCAGNEALTPPEVWALRDAETSANAPGWRVRIVPNKYPALEDHGEWPDSRNGFYQSINGIGVHEVIVESPHHVVNLAALDKDQFVHVLSAYRARLLALRKDPRWRYLLVYKNHGARAGATFEHIHSQLVGLPFVPEEAQREINAVSRHFETSGRCIYCEIVESEAGRGERLVLEDEHFVALCPFASRFGYETCILPKDHAAAFEESSDADLAVLAEKFRVMLAKLHRIADNSPFNVVIHTAPNDAIADHRYHWHMEILPQITRAAGFEWGTGVHINSIAPEAAARSLRDARL